jgi:hypothetical protein
MRRGAYLVTVGVLVGITILSAAVAFARLWYKQDIQFGTQHTQTSSGLPLDAVNASHIPLTTGGNVEATLVSLQSQINALSAALALKAPIASPQFTGVPVLPSGTTIGAVSAAQIQYLSAVTSSIQAQLNLKAANENAVITGSLTVSGEVAAQQYSTTGGDNTHFAHLGNTGDIEIPATDNSGLIWFNSTLLKWRTYTGSSIDNLAVEP